MEQLAAMKDTKIKQKPYNQSTIMQLGICGVTLENNNKWKICNFFVAPGNRQTLLGMTDIKLLNILTIICNIISTEREDKDVNCSTSRHSTHDAGSEQYCANTGLERNCKRTNSNL